MMKPPLKKDKEHNPKVTLVVVRRDPVSRICLKYTGRTGGLR